MLLVRRLPPSPCTPKNGSGVLGVFGLDEDGAGEPSPAPVREGGEDEDEEWV